MFLALLFAKLASMVPKVGGPYAYSRIGFGDFAGFWIAWGYWIAVWVGNAAIAVALVSYLGGVIPILGQQLWLSGLVAIGLIWLVTWINVMGIKQAGVFQVITTIMKLVPLVAMATIGLFWINWSHFIPFNTSGMSPFAAVTAVAALTLWAFLGVESATIPADDVKNPNKTIPRATVLGTILVGLVYILSTVAVMGILPLAQLGKSGAPFADAAGSVWGHWAFYAVGNRRRHLVPGQPERLYPHPGPGPDGGSARSPVPQDLRQHVEEGCAVVRCGDLKCAGHPPAGPELLRLGQSGDYLHLHHPAGHADDAGALRLLRHVGTDDLHQGS